MKLFILTHCAAEQNYTPHVFKTEQEAKKEMDRIVDELVYERDEDGEISYQYSDNFELQKRAAEIIYSDDTYDRLDIFEVEVE